MTDRLNELCQRLGYQFKDLSLLKAALTHSSLASEINNERLEFLGDSIVNFIIAKVLYQQMDTVREGGLSRYRSELVKGETLADIAQALNLADYLFLGTCERRASGSVPQSMLADALEAIIAAVYLDGGFEACEHCVQVWFGDRLEPESISNLLKDPKSALQEFCQAKKWPLPHYAITKTEGKSHQQTFTITCKVTHVNYISHGVATTRRKAEQIAAEDYLHYLQEHHGY